MTAPAGSRRAAGAAIGAVGIRRQRRDAGRILQQVRQRQRIFLVRAAAAIAAHGHGQFAAGQDRRALALAPRLQRQPRMVGGDVARLAFEIGAEIDDLVSGIPCYLDRGIERSLRLRDQSRIARGRRRDRRACSSRSWDRRARA